MALLLEIKPPRKVPPLYFFRLATTKCGDRVRGAGGYNAARGQISRDITNIIKMHISHEIFDDAKGHMRSQNNTIMIENFLTL